MNIRIPLSSSRAQQCSTSVHKSAEANPSVEPTKKLLHTSMTIVDSPADTSVAGLQDIIEKVLPHTVLQSKRPLKFKQQNSNGTALCEATVQCTTAHTSLCEIVPLSYKMKRVLVEDTYEVHIIKSTRKFHFYRITQLNYVIIYS